MHSRGFWKPRRMKREQKDKIDFSSQVSGGSTWPLRGRVPVERSSARIILMSCTQHADKRQHLALAEPIFLACLRNKNHQNAYANSRVAFLAAGGAAGSAGLAFTGTGPASCGRGIFFVCGLGRALQPAPWQEHALTRACMSGAWPSPADHGAAASIHPAHARKVGRAGTAIYSAWLLLSLVLVPCAKHMYAQSVA